MFSFMSGQRGPYGVQEYLFKVLEKDWSELSAIITRLLTSEYNYSVLGILLDHGVF